ncbi:MAG: glycosyltransferase family 2 protein [Planctomycetes bacterium]|nr:glycosyltransferase family 2 protein [Planctomycetota bacterium]
MPRLSLCMIVRDEQERLGRCLAAARPYVDEIVVVDTGSKDDTRNIALAHGAHVIEYTWQDDFAAARNASMEAASGDWLLFLDADEVLSPEAGASLRKLLTRKRVLGAFIPLRDEGEGAPKTVTLLFRAVRRRKDIRWRYRLHEQLLPDALRVAKAEGLGFEELHDEIRHDGYSTAVMESKGKHARNLRVFEAQLADTPNDAYMLYKFGDFLRDNPQTFVRAMELLGRSLTALQTLTAAECRELTFAGEVCALLALGALRTGSVASAGRVLDFGEKHCRATGHLAYARGQQCLASNDAVAALRAFTACTTFGGKAMLIPATARVSSVLAKVGQARALLLLGRNSQALPLAREALSADETDPDALRTCADAALALGDLRMAIGFAMDAISKNPSNPHAWLCGANVLFRSRMFPKAADWASRAAALLPENGAACALLGECFIHLERHADARFAFNMCAADPRCAAGLVVLAEIEGQSCVPLLDGLAAAECTRMLANLRDAATVS